MKHKPADSTLNRVWRDAVIARAHRRCMLCGANGTLEAHHIIKRRKKLTRWDPINGVALCPLCHAMQDRLRGQAAVWGKLTTDEIAHLDERDGVVFTDWLIMHEQTENEFRAEMLAKCKGIVHSEV